VQAIACAAELLPRHVSILVQGQLQAPAGTTSAETMVASRLTTQKSHSKQDCHCSVQPGHLHCHARALTPNNASQKLSSTIELMHLIPSITAGKGHTNGLPTPMTYRHCARSRCIVRVNHLSVGKPDTVALPILLET
jgi:hypothetical protein